MSREIWRLGSMSRILIPYRIYPSGKVPQADLTG